LLKPGNQSFSRGVVRLWVLSNSSKERGVEVYVRIAVRRWESKIGGKPGGGKKGGDRGSKVWLSIFEYLQKKKATLIPPGGKIRT